MSGNTAAPKRSAESLLFEALCQIAPGKYKGVSILLRTPCRARHLKGGTTSRFGQYKDYNLSCHTFITGETVIRCLYGCGLSVSSFDVAAREDFKELAEAMDQDSTNARSSSERFTGTIPKVMMPPREPVPESVRNYPNGGPGLETEVLIKLSRLRDKARKAYLLQMAQAQQNKPVEAPPKAKKIRKTRKTKSRLSRKRYDV